MPTLINKPELISGILRTVLTPYNDEFSVPAARTIIIRVMRPVAEARIRIVRSFAEPGQLTKLGEALGNPDDDNEQFGHTLKQRVLNDFRSRRENFAPITVRDQYGHEAATSPYHMRQGMIHGSLFAKPTIAAALALGSIGAVLAQPSLLRKALALSALGIPAAALANVFSPRRKNSAVTSEGDVLSDSMLDSTWRFQKKTAALRTGTVAGMAIPGALALDYMYNQWKYGPYGAPEVELPPLKWTPLVYI